MEKILCAAIHYPEQPTPVDTVKNVEGLVLCGYRHGHIIGQCFCLIGKKHFEMGKSVQGFLTSYNRFLDRKKARLLFIENGGIPDFSDDLYSEDLY